MIYHPHYSASGSPHCSAHLFQLPSNNPSDSSCWHSLQEWDCHHQIFTQCRCISRDSTVETSKCLGFFCAHVWGGQFTTHLHHGLKTIAKAFASISNKCTQIVASNSVTIDPCFPCEGGYKSGTSKLRHVFRSMAYILLWLKPNSTFLSHPLDYGHQVSTSSSRDRTSCQRPSCFAAVMAELKVIRLGCSDLWHSSGCRVVLMQETSRNFTCGCCAFCWLRLNCKPIQINFCTWHKHR